MADDDPSTRRSLQKLPLPTPAPRMTRTQPSALLADDLKSYHSRFTTTVSGWHHAQTLSQVPDNPSSTTTTSINDLDYRRRISPHFRGSYSQWADDESLDSESPSDLIVRSFAPQVLIYASDSVDQFAKDKGFTNGFCSLLKPFGQRIKGKISVRDSNGHTQVFEDFGIKLRRFDTTRTELRDGLSNNPSAHSDQLDRDSNRMALLQLEEVMAWHLDTSPRASMLKARGMTLRKDATIDCDQKIPQLPSMFYPIYLKYVLSKREMVPHETFAHPVACVIIIDSSRENPIDELRHLYDTSSRTDKALTPWVDHDYLRYYVLLHDEENDDISRSMSLFDQMKRNFGIHCHLLRLRSTRCALSDDDSVTFPSEYWISAAEKLHMAASLDERVTGTDASEFADSAAYIFESDVTAIQSFLRDMVTQSLLPTMDRHIKIWNDQVASRRRGIAGRFMSLSRRWTGFGSHSKSSGSPSLGSGGHISTVTNEALGFYPPDSAEAIMRKLADFAFMLRDWRLAHSIYDLLRSDFNDTKMWKYHAAANEMASLALIMTARDSPLQYWPQSPATKTLATTVDQMLEASLYSYKTRCGLSLSALRSLLAGAELLRLLGGPCADMSAKWGMILLESDMLGPIGDSLVKERLSVWLSDDPECARTSIVWPGSRKRKSALWSILAAESWIKQGRYLQSQPDICRALRVYVSADGCIANGRYAASRYIEQLCQSSEGGSSLSLP
jgi:hypothetical protein